MPSRFTAQRGKGALFVALALVATLLVPSVYTWAVKSTGKPGGIDMTGSQDIKNIDPEALSYFRRQALPLPDRPLELSPFENFKRNLPPIGKRKGLMLTGAGFFNP